MKRITRLTAAKAKRLVKMVGHNREWKPDRANSHRTGVKGMLSIAGKLNKAAGKPYWKDRGFASVAVDAGEEVHRPSVSRASGISEVHDD